MICLKVKHLYSEKGLSLIELMLVLSFLGIVMAGIMSLFTLTQRAYDYTSFRETAINDTNILISKINRDIRSAQKPNEETHAVRVLSNGTDSLTGNEIVVYHSEGENYTQIRYRYNTSTNHIERGLVQQNTPPGDTANPDYGTIDNWQPIVHHVEPASNIFKDQSASSLTERRLIAMNLELNPIDPRTNEVVTDDIPLAIDAEFRVRSGRATYSVYGTTIPAYITGLQITSPANAVNTTQDDPYELPSWHSRTVNFIATASTNSIEHENVKLIWSYDPGSSDESGWISFPDTTYSQSGDSIRVRFSANYDTGPGGWGDWIPRTGLVIVTTECQQYTEIIHIYQPE